MRITLVHASYYYSGSEKSVELLARWLLDNGHEVRIVSAGNYRAPSDLKDIEVNVLPHKSTALQLHSLLPLARFMKHNEDSTDIYHIYNVFPMAAAGLYKSLGGKRPVIATLNNYAGFCPTASAIYDECNKLSCKIRCLRNSTTNHKPLMLPYAMIYPLLTRLSLKLDRYIAVSNAVKRLYVKYGYPEDRITVIPEFLFIDNLVLPNKNDDYVNVINNVFKVLYVGTLAYHKGIDVLINALKIIKDKYNSIHLTLVGSSKDNYEQFLRELVNKLDLNMNITFKGYVDDNELDLLYRVHDVFIHPARWSEPYARTIMEALIHGLPCIVSDIGGSQEIVGDAGIVFRNNDPDDLANKILMLISNKELLCKMHMNTIKVISKNDINLIGKRIIQQYEETIDNSISRM